MLQIFGQFYEQNDFLKILFKAKYKIIQYNTTSHNITYFNVNAVTIE